MNLKVGYKSGKSIVPNVRNRGERATGAIGRFLININSLTTSTIKYDLKARIFGGTRTKHAIIFPKSKYQVFKNVVQAAHFKRRGRGVFGRVEVILVDMWRQNSWAFASS